MTIAEVFDRNRFRLDHLCIKRPADETIVFRLNGFAHETDFRSLDRVLGEYGIDLRQELMRLPRKEYDNRPIWKKAMDMQMGKIVDFNRAPSYPPVHPDRLKAELEKIAATNRRKQYER